MTPSCSRVVSIALVLVAGVVFGLPRAAAEEESPAAPGGGLAGRWTLDPALSDDARQEVRTAREGMPGRAGGRGGPGGGSAPGGAMGGGRGGRRPGADASRPGLRAFLEAPAELTITPGPNEVVILERDGRMRILRPDGSKRRAEGGAAEVVARWQGGTLVVETRDEGGARVTESYAASPDGSRLTVNLRVEGPRMPPLELKRVYEPTEAELVDAPPGASPPGDAPEGPPPTVP